jgi:DNA ligase D-like protein (predicted 3'-phosphoesterase)
VLARVKTPRAWLAARLNWSGAVLTRAPHAQCTQLLERPGIAARPFEISLAEPVFGLQIPSVMPTSDHLATYWQKRDFRRTPEPRGRRHKPSRKPIFVIQKHAARALHYDVRLEVDGVLKSWAVPKGPSINPKDKRLAMLTEDHPLEYSTFEGVIPEGEYGAGRMIVWDRGIYRNLTEHNGKPVPMEDAFRHGRIRISLEGEKLHGAFALTRIGSGTRSKWLLVKKDDKDADAKLDIVRTAPVSILSGLTVEEMTAERTVRRRKHVAA